MDLEPGSVQLGRETCCDDGDAFEREWLVTNGIGGFAGGTIGDVLTRRYHGLLFAALQPPVGRTLLLAKLDTTVTYRDASIGLCANRFADGTLDPQGYRDVERFRLENGVPVWTFAFGDALLDRRVWMQPGHNTTFVRYELRRAGAPVSLSVRALVNDRDYHSLTRAYAVDGSVAIDGLEAKISMRKDGTTLYLDADRGSMTAGDDWYYGFRLAEETARGLDDLEDHFHALTLTATLAPGESLTVRASTHAPSGDDPGVVLETVTEKARASIETLRTALPGLPAWIALLAVAADQFIVDRTGGGKPGKTIVAGYHWFGDWGRDAMIALPGLTLVTGRPEIAKNILGTFAHFVDGGMLPNRFPDAGEAPEYNTVDATLWFVEAIRRYVEATNDNEFVREIFPVLVDIVSRHCDGTRYRIHVDGDGLLYAGQDGVQLTWMDAKVGNDVITPRIGKPVEINALWYSAVVTIGALARRIGEDGARYDALAAHARSGFAAFSNPATGYFFDVVGGPNGNDASIRPNALIAAGLPQSPMDAAQRKAAVDVAARELVTSYGLRTLSPRDPHYCGTYAGDQAQRDRAYHQGTVWPWLLGSFVTAHLAVYNDSALAATFLEGAQRLALAYGIGSLAEIADGDAPFHPRGCIAQAWSVGELLRAAHELYAGAGARYGGS